jgi:hypothetical protein
MRVIVHNHLDDTQVTFAGSEVELRQKLHEAYPWLQSDERNLDLEAIVDLLDDYQFFGVDLVMEPGESLGKSEDDLQKGAPQRLWGDFDPRKDPATSGEAKEAIETWQYDETGTREDIPKIEGPGRQRALHKIHAAAPMTRRNPESGEREFLLYRGGHLKRPVTSWSTHHNTARGFVGVGSDIKAAWIPESKVRNFLVMPEPPKDDWRSEYGANRNEMEVLVDKHDYQLTHPNLFQLLKEQDPTRYRALVLGGLVDARNRSSRQRTIQSYTPAGRIDVLDVMARHPDHWQIDTIRESLVDEGVSPDDWRMEWPGNYPSWRIKQRDINAQRALLESAKKKRQQSPQSNPELGKSESFGFVTDDFESWTDTEAVKPFLGLSHRLTKVFSAAQFLSGGKPISPDEARGHFYLAGGDAKKAALRAYGLSPSKANLKALSAISELQKSELFGQGSSLIQGEVEPAVPEAQAMADAIKRGIADDQVRPVKLGGKHVAGVVLVRDPQQNKTLILKPGSGGQSPAAGVRESPTTQAQREAAFFHVAKFWGLEHHVPHVDLILVGKSPWAAGDLLTSEFQTVEDRREEDPSYPARVLHKYLDNGAIFQWAILDWVLGNPDRHLANLMGNDRGEIQLIDHGSAFAGREFNPGLDQYSFIPGYLRFMHLDVDIHKVPVKDRLRLMPRLNANVASHIRSWADSLSPDDLADVLNKYQIDPAHCLERLRQIQGIQDKPIDLLMNELWAGAR